MSVSRYTTLQLFNDIACHLLICLTWIHGNAVYVINFGSTLIDLMTSLAGLFDCDWKHADDKFGQ